MYTGALTANGANQIQHSRWRRKGNKVTANKVTVNGANQI